MNFRNSLSREIELDAFTSTTAKLTGRGSRGAQGGHGHHESEEPCHIFAASCSFRTELRRLFLHDTLGTEYRGTNGRGTRGRRSEHGILAGKMEKDGIQNGARARAVFSCTYRPQRSFREVSPSARLSGFGNFGDGCGVSELPRGTATLSPRRRCGRADGRVSRDSFHPYDTRRVSQALDSTKLWQPPLNLNFSLLLFDLDSQQITRPRRTK